MGFPRYIDRHYRKRRTARQMALITAAFFLVMMLMHSLAARVDVPQVQGMTEEQVLTRYSKEITTEAQWRAEMLVNGDEDR